MDQGAGCFLPKPQLVPKIKIAVRENTTLPAPCVWVGEPELVYVHFALGLIIPVIVIIFLRRHGIYRLLSKVLHGRLCQNQCGQNIVADEKKEAHEFVVHRLAEEKEENARVTASRTSTLRRLRSLVNRKARIPTWHRFLSEAGSSQALVGQLMMSGAVLGSLVTIGIYYSFVMRHRQSLEFCGTMPNVYQIVDLAVNVYLLLFYFVRIFGSQKKQKAATDLHAFGDYFCIPASFINVALDRYFTGFAFFRCYNLIWIVDICANRGLVRSANTIRLLKLLVLVLTVVAISAGFLHLAENLGDPWIYDQEGTSMYNGQSVVYWRCFLFIYGRITWLDLSGMRILTYTGRIIVYGFQIIAMGIVGKAIPRIVKHLKIKPEYDKKFHSSSMFLHIIVCGHVTSGAMKSFLKEFYHVDRYFAEHFKIVVLSEDPPDESMDNLSERYFNKLEFRRGSVMKLKDLRRVNLEEATATLILGNLSSTDADADDAANTMRVVSVKNFKGDARVIVQLSLYHNKAYLQNIPSWNPRSGDTIVCIAELRLGLLAQSCNAPGFSTLMGNLFTTRSPDPKQKFSEPWMEDYVRGASMELYFRRFSPYFNGMTFGQACLFCYQRLGVVLIAVQMDPEFYDSVPQILPRANSLIVPHMIGYCLADHRSEVHRIAIYCKYCHEDVYDPQQIVDCNCDDAKRFLTIRSIAPDQTDGVLDLLLSDKEAVETKIWSYICEHPNTPLNRSTEALTAKRELLTIPPGPAQLQLDCERRLLFDSSGLFYWTRARPLASIRLTRLEAARRNFANHVVLCIAAQSNSQMLGLANFVMPLRSSSIREQDLCDILILADDEYVKKEWKYLYNLPRIFVVKGSSLNRSDLRAVNLNTCKMCVIIGAPNDNEKNTDSTMLDKNVILATLNVRAMKFSVEENVTADQAELGIPRSRLSGVWGKPTVAPWARRTGFEVPLLTDLTREANAQFLDDDDEDLPGTEFYLTQPYSGGRAFAATVLDLLMISSFFTPLIYRVVHSLIFGGNSPHLERLMAEGAGLIGPGSTKNVDTGDLVQVVQITLENGPLSHHIGSTYGALFTDSLLSSNLLVLGLSRKMDDKCDKRFVICNPPQSLELLHSDALFALQRADASGGN